MTAADSGSYAYSVRPWWRVYLPHKATGEHKIRCTMRQILGGKHWSLILMTKIEPAQIDRSGAQS